MICSYLARLRANGSNSTMAKPLGHNADKGFNLTQQTAHQLGEAIVSGEYGVHNPVPSEAVLCDIMNVSRSAAREAVKSLAAKGLISSRARQGIRVLPESEWNLFDADVLTWIRNSNPSLELLKEFAELRVAVEPIAAQQAAQQQDLEKIAEMAVALERMKAADAGLDDPLNSDIAFHMSILDASGNRFFSQLGRITDTTLRVSIRVTNNLFGVTAASYENHKRVYDAIHKQQPDKARKAMQQLVESALALIVDALQEKEQAAK